MALTSQDAWSAYAQAVLQSATSGQFDPSTQTFSLAGQTLNVDLADADPEITNASVFAIGNDIPAAGGAYTSGSSLIGAYFDFLQYVKLDGDPNPNLQSQINIAASDSSKAQVNYIEVQSSAVAAWQAYKAIDPNITFPDYVRTQYPLYGEAQSALTAAVSRYEGLMIQAYGPGYQTIVNARAKAGFTAGAQAISLQNTYNMSVKLGSSAPAGSGPQVLPGQNPPPLPSSLISTFAPGFTLGGDFVQKYQEWQTQSTQQPPVMNGMKISLSASSTATKWSNFGWSAAARASFPVGWFTSVKVSGQASYSEQKFDYASSAFRFEVSFLGSGVFPISSNLWYDQAIVKNYHNKLRSDAPDFFSENGSLARVPVQAVIGFQPKIKMTVSQSDYSSFKSQFQESVNVAYNFGPFTIGSANESVYSQKSAVKFDDSSNSFEVGPVVSTVPQLVGIICSKSITT